MMFSLKSIISHSSVLRTCRNFARFTKKDPGIQHRKTLLVIPDHEEIEDFEELESDFMQAHHSHKQHMQELELQKEREKYLIVKQKYFKNNLPNFLTWHDKEQIKYLHRTDPEEWTVERLSEGFPALPHVIKQIVKSNWTKVKQHKITNHDNSVQRNWQLFKAGKMPDLPKELVEHLNKFTNRALKLNQFVVPQKHEATTVEVKKNTRTDFSDIIRSYQQLKEENIEKEKQVDIEIPDVQPGETYSLSSMRRGKQVTLSELQSKLKKQIETGKNIDEEERSILESQNLKLKKDTNNETAKNDLIDISKNKYEKSTGIQHFTKTKTDLSYLNYPERITIPKKIYKKGCLYKLNDCYYDDDGEFLYRVPGMT